MKAGVGSLQNFIIAITSMLMYGHSVCNNRKPHVTVVTKHPERRKMTNNQISYQKLQEERRHNAETEAVGKSQAQSAQYQAGAALQQALSASKNAETNLLNAQTNVRNSELRGLELDETRRANDIKQQQADTEKSRAKAQNFKDIASGAQSTRNVIRSIYEDISGITNLKDLGGFLGDLTGSVKNLGGQLFHND